MQKLILAAGLWAALSASAFAQTVASVTEVYRVFQNKCVSCHDHASPEGALDLEGSGANELLRAQNVASKLVNFNPDNEDALNHGYKRVYPGRPDKSFLFKKINFGLESTIPALTIDEGNVMPSYPSDPLTAVEKEIVRQWILYGAKNTGVLFDKAVVEDYYTNGGDQSFPDGPPAAPAPGEGFQIKMGPFFLPPDGEVEYFQKYELAMPSNVEVNKLDFKISPFSHHFLTYNFTGTGAASIPAGLRLNADHSQINLVAAVQEATSLVLPNKTAFKWDKNIVLDLNSHYINYSLTKPYLCEAYVNIYTQAPGTAEQEMFAALLINENISIPNNSNLITATKSEYQFGADSIYLWGLMGHTHKYGQGYKAWYRMPNGAKGTQIYDASCPMGLPGCPTPWYDYRHIPIRYWEPLLPLKWGNGLIHEAQWINDGPNSVHFGPTSDDEMMVLIAFYTEQQITIAAEEPKDKMPAALTISPNPAQDKFYVSIPGVLNIQNLSLYNTAGQEVLRRKNMSGSFIEVETAGLTPGMYFLDADGRKGRLMLIR